uniref:Defensin-like protein n=1 Tax=Cicer arietinum TaxID=3827 RepID=A0A1S3EEY0_CICAR|nr:defensin-like protein 183 [Cicer arietinum]
MANQMPKYFYFFAILVLVVKVQLIEVEGTCTKIIGQCSATDCGAHCNSFARGVRTLGWSCSFFNLCTCTFDQPPPGLTQPACEVGLGICTRECGQACCNAKCVSHFPHTGVGTCIDAFNMILCLCSYQR